MHPRPAILLLLFGGMGWSLAAAELPGWVIEAPEGVDIDLNTSIATATNGVTVKYGGKEVASIEKDYSQRDRTKPYLELHGQPVPKE